MKTKGFAVLELLVGLLVLAILAGGVWVWWGQAKQYSKQSSSLTAIPTSTAVGEEAGAAVPTPAVTTSGGESIYYYQQSWSEPEKFSVYRFDLSGPVLQEKILELPGKYQVFGTYKKPGQYLIGNGNKLSVLDIYERKTSNLVTIEAPDKMSLASAFLSNDKKVLAYVIDNTLQQADKGKAELWLYNLETQEKKKIFEDTLGLFAELRILGWNKTDEHIVLRETGGDAGAVWGQLFIVSTKTPHKSQEIKQASSSKDFLLGQLSPDGNRWLFSECGHPGETPAPYLKNPCPEGEQLKIYNFLTGQTQSIYRNNSNGNNLSKDKLRVIFDYKWKDDDTVVISIPDGIYQLKLPSQTPSRLYRLIWRDPSFIFRDGGILLRLVNQDFVISERMGEYAGKFILNLASGRVTEFGERAVEGFFE